MYFSKTGHNQKNIKHMTIQEQIKLKTAKSTFKSVKKNYPHLHKELRNEVIRALVKSDPNFGSVSFIITTKGV